MKQKGFTILHLMILVCAVGVAAVLLLPLYADLIFRIAR